MLKLGFKIGALANLAVFLVFAISLFPTGFSYGLNAVLYSSLFSSPAIIIINLLLLLLEKLRGRILFNWIVFLLSTGLTAYVSFFLFRLWFKEDMTELNFILPLCMVSGYAAVVFVSPRLHYHFEKFQYENEAQYY